MTTVLNQIAEKWFSWELSMFWQVGVLIIIVAGLDLLIKKWAWPQVRYALWLLVLVKLVLPPSLTSPTSFTAEIPFLAKEAAIKISQPQTTPQIIETVKKPIEPIIVDTTTQSVEIIPAAPAAVSLSWKVHTFFVWLAGVIILSGWLIIRLRSLRRQHLKDQSRLPERLEDLLASTARKLGLKKVPQIILTNKVCCPAIFGVFQPVLLMPADKLQNLTAQDAENIFLHELAHIKRGDLFVHAVYMILQIAYWFNPLLWLIRKQLQNLRELCCDATVARLLREKTVGYRQTLLETARQLLAQPVDPGLGLLGLFENSSWLVDRLRWLEKKSWKFRLLRIATIFIMVCLMAACVLPMAKFNPGHPELVIKGIITNSQTGEPIAGAKVFDDGYGPAPDWDKIRPDQQSEWGAITNSKGEYSFLTWPEHHCIKAEAAGFKAEQKTLYSGHFTLNKKDVEVLNFALQPDKRTGKQADNNQYPAVGRERVNVIQLPAKENDYELIVNFDDDKWGGPSWYDVTINVIPVEAKQAEKLSIHVRAYIDGISNLVFKGNSVYWHNLKWAVPGRHGGNDYPTYINDIEWMPQWLGEKTPTELREEQKSKTFNLPFSLPRQPVNVQIKVEKPSGQVNGETHNPITIIAGNVGGMLAEMQPSITEIQKEAVKLKQLKEQNAPESEIKASEKRIDELSKKIDAIGDKWGEKMNSIGEQLGKNIETWVKEYDWQQFSEKMAEWGRQFGEQMQQQYGQADKWDSGKNSFERAEELSAPFAENSILSVNIPDGKVTVTGGTGNECKVAAKIRARASTAAKAEEIAKQVRINLKQEAGKTTITANNCENKNVSVDLNIITPRKASVQCQIGDGTMACSELEGNVTAAVGDGSVSITKLLGNTSITLGDGKITCVDSKGSFNTQLGDGRIIAQNAEFAEKCNVKIGDGQLIFENIRGKAHYEIGVKDGTVKMAFAKDADGVGNIGINVADGKIEFGCPANMSARIKAETRDGKINTSLPLAVKREEDSSSLEGTVGTGEGYIELNVNDGSIVINANDGGFIKEKQTRVNDKTNNATRPVPEPNQAKALRITIYENNNTEPEINVRIPLVAMKIARKLLPPKDKLQIIAQKMELDKSMPQGMDCNTLIDTLDEMLKQFDQGVESTTLLEVKNSDEKIIISLE